MFGKKKTEVLVVGAGPVGLFTALQLARRDIRVEVIDKDWRTGAHSYALALHANSLRLFQEAGLLAEVLQEACLVRTIGIYGEGRRQAELRAAAGSVQQCLAAVLRQDVLEALLENALKSLGVSVQWNHELSELEAETDGNRATIDRLVKETVGYAVAHTEWTVGKTTCTQVPLVIGADGHRSTVRRRLGIDFKPAGQTQHFAVFECRTGAELPPEMQVVFADGAVSVLWPMRDGRCRWSFQLLNDAAPEATRAKQRLSVELGMKHFPVLSEESLQQLLRARAPWFDATIEEVLWRIVVRFEQRQASRFGQDRVWLVGDAGHVTGPVAMQSMNVGFSEASELAGLVAGILRQREPIEGLKAYNQGRLNQWSQLLGLPNAFRADDSASPWVRQFSHQLLPCLPAFGTELQQLAAQLHLQPA